MTSLPAILRATAMTIVYDFKHFIAMFTLPVTAWGLRGTTIRLVHGLSLAHMGFRRLNYDCETVVDDE
jgi:hypothetical protein